MTDPNTPSDAAVPYAWEAIDAYGNGYGVFYTKEAAQDQQNRTRPLYLHATTAPPVAAAPVVDEGGKNAHTEHCCAQHGCKYADEDCPVTTGQQAQSFLCESCDSANEGKGGGDASMNHIAMRKLSELNAQGWNVNGVAIYRNGKRGLIDNLGAVHWIPDNPPTAPDGDWVVVPKSALDWLFGEAGTFECAPEHYFRGKPPMYWWRSEFRRRIAAAPKPEGQS